MEQVDTETNFLLELLKYTPASETARIHEKLQRAQDHEQFVKVILKRVAHVALLGGICFLFTAFSLPHLSDAVVERLSQFFFLVSGSASACALVFFFVWRCSCRDLTIKREACRCALREHLQPRLDLAFAPQEREEVLKPDSAACIPFRRAVSEAGLLAPPFMDELASARAS